ncbi:MAG: PAS domain-containing sensor histidine kinase [Bacteroidetes bacterium]|nr:MAG: PAS domain-containing sensor histidine kinase [Bacteroidota bacterium]
MEKMNEHEQASRLKAIIDTAIDGIITIDTTGDIESINPAAARLFGYQAEEVIGKNITLLMPDPYHSQHAGYMERYLQTGEKRIIGIGREVAGKRKDGSVFPFRLAISEVKLVDGVHIFTGIIHDLSREKQAEEQLRHYAAELERSNKELENFAYVSSHDLQEPLRKIQAFGSRLQERERENLGEQGADYLDRMLNAAQRMQTLINDLLTFSRVSTRTQPFVPVNLNRVVKEVLSDLEISIREADAHIETGPLPVVPGDPTQMRQLFQNLISNAVKFRKDGQAPEIHIYEQRHPGAVAGIDPIELHVKDNGIGFDEKYLDRIFDIFQRLEGRKYPGSGVGLSICRRIATRHGGTLTAKSQPGEGTTFIITLSAQNLPESGQ